MKRTPSPLLIVAALLAIYLCAAAIEPCDGHSCRRQLDKETFK